MTDTPKEIYATTMDMAGTGGVFFTDGDGTKYIRADLVTDDAFLVFYNRGLERAAEIADEAEREFEYSAAKSANAAQAIAAAIRAEKDKT